MRKVCGWCGALLVDGPPAPVSHGMCDACKAKIDRAIDADPRSHTEAGRHV